MYGALKPLLFSMDPERAHHLALAALRPVHRSQRLRRALARSTSSRLASTFLGHKVPAPLGMAAGFDKGAEVYNALLALGFGHVEVGTVTPRPQPGNEGARLQRFPELHALVNRLGFPGPGCDAVANRMRKVPATGLVGGNIGPNKTTPADEVHRDLSASAGQLARHVGFLTVNVSSPNTPGLRALQAPDAVARLVRATMDAAQDSGHRRAVLLKLHPDASDAELVAVARAAVDAGASGIVATNTTRGRPAGTETAIEGGLSGGPLKDRARQAIAALHAAVGDQVAIVGVGGILTAENAMGHIRAGASLVQAYTGFVYGGPGWPRAVHAGLVQELDHLGLDRIGEAIGIGAG